MNNVGGLGGGSRRAFRSGQYEEEWKIYRDILNRSNVTKYTKWLDIRGNHGKTKFGFYFSKKINLILIDRCIYGFRSRFIEKFLSVRIVFIENIRLNNLSN